MELALAGRGGAGQSLTRRVLDAESSEQNRQVTHGTSGVDGD
jgi:hypothetical protein